MELTVMTFNVQHFEHFITREIQYDDAAEAIRRCGADVVGLNEVRGQGTSADYQAQAQLLAEQLGWHYFFARAIDFPEGPYGNAIVSRYPILSADILPIPDPPFHQNPKGYYETRCLLRAQLDVPGGLTVLVCHYGLNPDEQENAVATFLSAYTGARTVYMGDFNLQPEDPLLAPVFARMQDTARAFHAPRFSFPSDKPDRKIDYIFVSPDLTVKAADIPAVVVSDHRPYTALLEI